MNTYTVKLNSVGGFWTLVKHAKNEQELREQIKRDHPRLTIASIEKMSEGFMREVARYKKGGEA